MEGERKVALWLLGGMDAPAGMCPSVVLSKIFLKTIQNYSMTQISSEITINVVVLQGCMLLGCWLMQRRWMVFHTTMASSQLVSRSSAWEMQKLARHVGFELLTFST